MSYLTVDQRIRHEKRIIAQYIIATLQGTDANGIRIDYVGEGECKTILVSPHMKAKFKTINSPEDAATVKPFVRKVLKEVEQCDMEDILFEIVESKDAKMYPHVTRLVDNAFGSCLEIDGKPVDPESMNISTDSWIRCVYGNSAYEVVADSTVDLGTLPLGSWVTAAEQRAEKAETAAYEKYLRNQFKDRMAEIDD